VFLVLLRKTLLVQTTKDTHQNANLEIESIPIVGISGMRQTAPMFDVCFSQTRIFERSPYKQYLNIPASKLLVLQSFDSGPSPQGGVT